MREIPKLQGSRFGWKFRSCNKKLVFDECAPEKRISDYEYTLAIIRDKALWFSNPEEFNDPFDSTHQLPAMASNESKKMIAEGIKIRTSCDAPGHYIQEADRRSQEFQVLSLCGHVDDTLMWSHYADGHRGLALGFNFDNDRVFKSRARIHFKLWYEKTFAEFWRKANKDHSDMLEESFSAEEKGKAGQRHRENLIQSHHILHKLKGKDWQHERERRFLAAKSKNNEVNPKGQNVKFSPESLEFVIFGAKTCKTVKDEIRDLLKDPSWKHVKVFETSPDLIEQKLIYTPL